MKINEGNEVVVYRESAESSELPLSTIKGQVRTYAHLQSTNTSYNKYLASKLIEYDLAAYVNMYIALHCIGYCQNQQCLCYMFGISL